MSKPILFFGNERLATGVTTQAPLLRALIEAGYKVAAVVIAQSELAKSRQSRNLEIADLAAEHGIEVISPDNIAEATEHLAAYGAPLAVLAAYGNILPQTVIDIFPQGIVNLHPSLLPLHRGSIPIESVILSGETSSGVSLMELGVAMDDGPVYAQQAVSLEGNETKQQLADQFGTLGAELLIKHLPAILDGSLEPQPQTGEPTYDERIDKSAGKIDWTKPAIQLEREIRAYAGWPRSRTTLGGNEIIVTQAHVSDGKGEAGKLIIEDRTLGVYCGEGLLLIDSLIPAGKKEMSAASFLAGYKL